MERFLLNVTVAMTVLFSVLCGALAVFALATGNLAATAALVVGAGALAWLAFRLPANR